MLIFEFEPTPRAFAVPLLVLATGLAAHRRYLGAGIAGAAAFLIHPPTVYPFWAVYAVLRGLETSGRTSVLRLCASAGGRRDSVRRRAIPDGPE